MASSFRYALKKSTLLFDLTIFKGEYIFYSPNFTFYDVVRGN